jgi:hypothetical protein
VIRGSSLAVTTMALRSSFETIIGDLNQLRTLLATLAHQHARTPMLARTVSTAYPQRLQQWPDAGRSRK